MKKRTVVNPMDLNYDYRIYNHDGKEGPICLEAADPVMVIFEGEYYLFSSITNGYWVSPDMAQWEFIPCDNSKLPNIYGYAPAIMVLDGAIYFHQGEHDKRLFRNKTPKNPDTWELVTDNCYVGHDPFLYYDEIDNRVWASYGCDAAERSHIQIVELDRHTLEPIGEIYSCVDFDPQTRGWERRLDDHYGETGCWLEGSQILRHNNKWYLIYSGFSLHKGYANGVYVSDSPTGPYVYAQNNPISHKNTGFIGGAAHGCFFEDLHGNWWNVTCACVHVSHVFERRLNLFPAGFDEDGFLYANTTLSDYPITLPDGRRDHSKLHVPYMLLSKDCDVTVSAVERAMPENPFYGSDLRDTQVPESRYDHGAYNASSEDIRTAWKADSREPGHWAKLDLDRICSVNGIQINIPTYNLRTTDPLEKYHEYVIESSVDGENWNTLYDNRGKNEFAPHGYYEVDEIRARYVKVTFFHIAGDGFAALSGLRVFGHDDSELPEVVSDFTAVRGPEDMRNATISWKSVKNAKGYIVRYGIAPDKLYNQYQVYGESIEIRTLTVGINYWFRVDSFNCAGVTMGKIAKNSI